MVDVPIDALLSRDYARQRRDMIRPDRAWPEMPPAGDPRKLIAERAPHGAAPVPERAFIAPQIATSHVSGIDRHRTAAVATPRDVYQAGLANLERRIDKPPADALGGLGHKIEWGPDWTWLGGDVCTVVADQQTGVLKGGADPRRPSYAVGL